MFYTLYVHTQIVFRIYTDTLSIEIERRRFQKIVPNSRLQKKSNKFRNT